MKVTARDVYGGPLPLPCDIWVEGLGRSARRRRLVARAVPPNGRAEFSVARQSAYRVRVVCEGHVEVARAVDGSTPVVELTVPVDPSAVVGFDWPAELPVIPGVTTPPPPDTWNALDDRRRGTVLNLWAKLGATWLGVAPAAALIEAVLEVREDRIIARAAPSLDGILEDARRAGLVRLVNGALHRPPAGYDRGPSYKSPEAPCNLQLSLFFAAAGAAGEFGALLVDADVDEARGFAHVFDVVRHAVTGAKTNEVEVQQILATQGIDAGWRPRVA